jgi:8-oxo-dGTP pyrophosphatase MutT (NUDIX family)
LVRTTGGRWSFPKGNIGPEEERWFAAEREAFVEAGATGDIEHESLTTYLHEKKEWKIKGIAIKIHTFLLEVKIYRILRRKIGIQNGSLPRLQRMPLWEGVSSNTQ